MSLERDTGSETDSNAALRSLRDLSQPLHPATTASSPISSTNCANYSPNTSSPTHQRYLARLAVASSALIGPASLQMTALHGSGVVLSDLPCKRTPCSRCLRPLFQYGDRMRTMAMCRCSTPPFPDWRRVPSMAGLPTACQSGAAGIARHIQSASHSHLMPSTCDSHNCEKRVPFSTAWGQ